MNFIDALLNRILHIDPRTLALYLFALCALVGFVASLLPAVFFQLASRTKRARAAQKRDLNADLQRKYERVCAELQDTKTALVSALDEVDHQAGLIEQQRNFSRNWNAEAKR